MKRFALFATSTALALWATADWRFGQALAVVVAVAGVSYVVGAVAWPKRKKLWWRA